MGFNISLINANNPLDENCSAFINRTFYNFIVSYEVHGETSVIIRTGEYFNIDLHPLTNLAYTWDNIPNDEIELKKQTVEALLMLIEDYKTKINLDLSFIKNVDFSYEDYFASYSETELKSMKKSGLIVDPDWNEKVEMHEYFINGQINEDLEAFQGILKCFQFNNVEGVVITAG